MASLMLVPRIRQGNCAQARKPFVAGLDLIERIGPLRVSEGLVRNPGRQILKKAATLWLYRLPKPKKPSNWNLLQRRKGKV